MNFVHDATHITVLMGHVLPEYPPQKWQNKRPHTPDPDLHAKTDIQLGNTYEKNRTRKNIGVMK
jgi:hypothetical protein